MSALELMVRSQMEFLKRALKAYAPDKRDYLRHQPPTLARQMSSNRSAALHLLRRSDDAMLPSLPIEIDVGWRVI